MKRPANTHDINPKIIPNKKSSIIKLNATEMNNIRLIIIIL